LTLPFSSPTRIDHVILQEDCTAGQRIRAYALEGRGQGAWRPLAAGSAIGHKRLQPVTPTVVDAVRLTVKESVGQGVIRRFAVFNTGAPPPADYDAPPHLWAIDAVGKWTDSAFSLDLSAKIEAAGAYQVRLVPQDGAALAVEDFELRLDGVPQPNLVRGAAGAPDVLTLTLPGVGQKVEIRGRVRGAEKGTLLLRRL
jgi:alpha-L-fucosidase